LRLSQAARLLQETTLPIADIANVTGFASPSSFTRAFREKFGHAPRQQRKLAA
jgi:transcriptional regulator GlxA family with amidase domain